MLLSRSQRRRAARRRLASRHAPRVSRFARWGAGNVALGAAVLALGVLLALLVAVISYRAQVMRSEALVQRATTDLAERAANGIARALGDPLLVVRAISGGPEPGAPDVYEARALEADFFRAAALVPSIKAVRFVSTRGDAIAVERRADGGFVTRLRDASGVQRAWETSAPGDRSRPIADVERDVDGRTWPWYRDAMQAGRAVWSPVDHEPGRAPAVTFGIPVRGNWAARPVGVVAVDLALASFAELLRDAAHDDLVAYVMGRDGVLIAASGEAGEQGVVARASVAERRPAAVASHDGLVSASAAEVLRRASGANAERGRFFRQPDLAGDVSFVAVQPLAVADGPDWLVVAAAPRHAITAGAAADAAIAALAVIAFVASVIVIGAATLRRQREDLESMTVVVDRLATLDPAAPATTLLPTARPDAVGAHGRALHRLVTRMRALLEASERRAGAAESAGRPSNRGVQRAPGVGEEHDRSAARLRTLEVVVEQSGEAIVLGDADGRIEFANRAFERLTGYPAEEVRGLPIAELRADESNPSSIEEALATVRQHGVFRGVLASRGHTGREFFADVTMSPVESATGAVTGFVAVLRDATERVKREAEIHYLAKFDALTRLPNRVSLLEHLQTITRAGRRERDRGLKAAVLYIDLDGFKPVNDRFGHHVGDRLLAEIADRLRNELRADDMVARVGGDEFVAVLDGVTDLAAALMVANKIIEAIEAPIFVSTVPVRVTASVGLAMYPDHGTDAFYLIKLADAAMYVAKEQGGSKAAVCRPGPEQDVGALRAEEDAFWRGRSEPGRYPFPQRLAGTRGAAGTDDE